MTETCSSAWKAALPSTTPQSFHSTVSCSSSAHSHCFLHCHFTLCCGSCTSHTGYPVFPAPCTHCKLQLLASTCAPLALTCRGKPTPLGAHNGPIPAGTPKGYSTAHGTKKNRKIKFSGATFAQRQRKISFQGFWPTGDEQSGFFNIILFYFELLLSLL